MKTLIVTMGIVGLLGCESRGFADDIVCEWSRSYRECFCTDLNARSLTWVPAWVCGVAPAPED